jgi:hypothetical protein
MINWIKSLLTKKQSKPIAQEQTPMDVVLLDEERTECEVWSRVMGYHRPISSFNIGKKGEFKERKFFKP